MGTLTVIVLIPLAFGAASLLTQLAGVEVAQRSRSSNAPKARAALEHPFHARVEGMPRTRTDRRDLQLALGDDFAESELDERVWPRARD